MTAALERCIVQIGVTERVYDRLRRDARAAGRPVSLYVKLLFEAAYAVRVGTVDDAELAEAIGERVPAVAPAKAAPTPSADGPAPLQPSLLPPADAAPPKPIGGSAR